MNLDRLPDPFSEEVLTKEEQEFFEEYSRDGRRYSFWPPV